MINDNDNDKKEEDKAQVGLQVAVQCLEMKLIVFLKKFNTFCFISKECSQNKRNLFHKIYAKKKKCEQIN